MPYCGLEFCGDCHLPYCPLDDNSMISDFDDDDAEEFEKNWSCDTYDG